MELTRVPLSMTRTPRPWRRTSMAQARPTGPAPITTTSRRSGIRLFYWQTPRLDDNRPGRSLGRAAARSRMPGVTPIYSQRQPFDGTRAGGYRVTPPGSPKDTRHHVVSLAGSGIPYRPGDALGVWPSNPEPIVDAILERLGATGEESVAAGREDAVPFRMALLRNFELTVVSRRLLEACLAQGAAMFGPLLEKGNEPQLKEYLQGRDAV